VNIVASIPYHVGMAKYSWATDVHLDFLPDERVVQFADTLIRDNPTGIFLSGDISNSKRLITHLSMLDAAAHRPIYFVLGNHDYYGSSIEQVRKQMHELSNISPFLRYVPTSPYSVLTPSTALVGADGWYDALLGDVASSTFGLADWTAIREFVDVNGSKAGIVTLARKLAHESVLHVHNGIKSATRYHKNIIVLTHVPPFPESHVHQGKQGDNNAMPWFTSKFLGDLLLQASEAYPKINFTVLCGHTHGRWVGQIKPNLVVRVGGAEYNKPEVQQLIDIV